MQGYGPPPGAPPPGGYGSPNPYGPPPGGPPGFGPPPMGGPPGMPGGGAPQTDPLAIVSLVSGIAALLIGWCCYLSLLLGPAALICGFISMSRIKKEPHKYAGHGLALGGVITGGLSLVVLVLLFILGVGLQLANRF